MNKLPEKLSDLITLAYEDAKKVLRTPGYEMHMLVWHHYDGRACQVCLAGAVMANTLEVNREESITPENFYDVVALALNALDAFRMLELEECISRFYGWEEGAAHYAGIQKLYDKHIPCRKVRLMGGRIHEKTLDNFFNSPIVVEFRQYLVDNNL